jgi:phage I-like protein
MLENTLKKRPDLIAAARSQGLLSKADEAWLRQVGVSHPAAQ